MADVEAKLIVKVVDQATKALKSIQKDLGGIDKLVKDNAKAIRTFGLTATAAGGAVTAALGLAVHQFVQTGDALQKMAVRTGFSTEALSELRYAADLSDTSLEALEMGILSMSKFLEGANDGLNTSVDALTKLGLSVKDVQGLGPEETFFRLAAAVAEVPDPMQRLALASEVFGRAGKDMLPLLASGAAGFEEMRAEAHRLGIVFDAEAANAAAELADDLTRLQAVQQGLANQVATVLVPVLADLAETVQPVIERVVRLAKENPEVTKTVVLVTAALAGLLTVVGSLSIGLLAVSSALGVVGLSLAAGGALAVAIGGVVALLVVLIQHWEGLKFMAGQAVDYIVEKVRGLLGVLAEVRDQFQAFFDLAALKIKQLNTKSLLGPSLSHGRDLSAADAFPVPRAGGGRADEPLTLVGEEGPEVVSLPRGSFVHTAGETRRMLGGVTIGAVHVHNEADEDRLVRKLTRLIELQHLQAA